MRDRLCSAAPRTAPQLTLPALSQPSSHPTLGAQTGPYCALAGWARRSGGAELQPGTCLALRTALIFFPLGISPWSHGGAGGTPDAAGCSPDSLPSPIQAVPVPATPTPPEPRTGRTATCGECSTLPAPCGTAGVAPPRHLPQERALGSCEQQGCWLSGSAGAQAGWWGPVPNAFTLAYLAQRARGLEPLPSFSTCLCGIRSPRWVSARLRCRHGPGTAGVFLAALVQAQLAQA